MLAAARKKLAQLWKRATLRMISDWENKIAMTKLISIIAVSPHLSNKGSHMYYEALQSRAKLVFENIVFKEKIMKPIKKYHIEQEKSTYNRKTQKERSTCSASLWLERVFRFN